jgi:hypothetical protein
MFHDVTDNPLGSTPVVLAFANIDSDGNAVPGTASLITEGRDTSLYARLRRRHRSRFPRGRLPRRLPEGQRDAEVGVSGDRLSDQRMWTVAFGSGQRRAINTVALGSALTMVQPSDPPGEHLTSGSDVTGRSRPTANYAGPIRVSWLTGPARAAM